VQEATVATATMAQTDRTEPMVFAPTAQEEDAAVQAAVDAVAQAVADAAVQAVADVEAQAVAELTLMEVPMEVKQHIMFSC
jgi:hypothetical protein